MLLNGALFDMDYVLIVGEYNRCACVRCVVGVLRLQEVCMCKCACSVECCAEQFLGVASTQEELIEVMHGTESLPPSSKCIYESDWGVEHADPRCFHM